MAVGDFISTTMALEKKNPQLFDAVSKFINDSLRAYDTSVYSIAVVLDLSKAHDTIDHTLVRKQLSTMCNKAVSKTIGPRTLALCLTPAVGMTNGNFLQTYYIKNS